MNVGKLIELLEEIPKDAEVVISQEFGLGWGGHYSEYDPKPDYYPNKNKVYL